MSSLKMANSLIVSAVVVGLLGLTSFACEWNSDCDDYSVCCDGICRSSCTTTCIYDSDCESGECCNSLNECSAYCSYDVLSDGGIAGVVIGSVIFVVIVGSIVSCFFCSCCPYFYRRPGAVIVTGGQPPYQQFVSTTTTTSTAPQPMALPPSGAYGQPPPYYPPPQARPNPPPPQQQGQQVPSSGYQKPFVN